MRTLHISSRVRLESDFLYVKYKEYVDSIDIIPFICLVESLRTCGDYVLGDVLYRLLENSKDKEQFRRMVLKGILVNYVIKIDKYLDIPRYELIMDIIFNFNLFNDSYMEDIVIAINTMDEHYKSAIDISTLKERLTEYLSDRDASDGDFLLLDMLCGGLV